MTQPQPQKGAWVIVTMMFIFMGINFADKAVLGLTAVPIMKELHLTPKDYGLIASSFFLLFSLSGIMVGFLVNRFQTRWALLAMGLIWALSQFPVLGSASFETLIACRVVLGAGEGPAYAVALHAAYKWLPNEKRTLPTSIISQGATVGPLVALPLPSMGHRPVFLALGLRCSWNCRSDLERSVASRWARRHAARNN